MIRELILGLAITGPALAQQPSDQINKTCSKQSFEGANKYEGFRIDHPDVANNFAGDHFYGRDFNKQIGRLFERCMLEHGFKFRTDNHYCTSSIGDDPPSLAEAICYERIR